MEDYLHNSLFVEDLVEYNFETTHRSWKATVGVSALKSELGQSRFDPAIGLAFYYIHRSFIRDIIESYTELRTICGVKNRAGFSSYAIKEAYRCFTEGYTHECFLAYCVHVLGVAGIYHVFEQWDILDTAVQIVALVLFSHQMTGQFYRRGGWHGLVKVSRKLNRIFADENIES